MFLKRVLPRQ